MKQNINRPSSDHPLKEHRDLSAESILKWLEESNQFVRAFLSPEDIQKWRKSKIEIPDRTFPK